MAWMKSGSFLGRSKERLHDCAEVGVLGRVDFEGQLSDAPYVGFGVKNAHEGVVATEGFPVFGSFAGILETENEGDIFPVAIDVQNSALATGFTEGVGVIRHGYLEWWDVFESGSSGHFPDEVESEKLLSFGDVDHEAIELWGELDLATEAGGFVGIVLPLEHVFFVLAGRADFFHPFAGDVNVAGPAGADATAIAIHSGDVIFEGRGHEIVFGFLDDEFFAIRGDVGDFRHGIFGSWFVSHGRLKSEVIGMAVLQVERN